jgi:cyclophilin family peptidyl-prolyl cis-trans isomerase
MKNLKITNRYFAIILMSAMILMVGCKGKKKPAAEPNSPDINQPQAKKVPAEAAPVSPKGSAEADKIIEEHKMVKLETSKGDIVIELNETAAPVTSANFLKYVQDGFYDGTIFHRVIPGFMIQGGGFTPDMTQKTTRAPITNEARNGLKNDRGSVAMARTTDPDSATAQFFINHIDNGPLNYSGPRNPGYAVFGKVTEGMDVVDAIAKVNTSTKGPYENVPVEPVIIKSAKIVNAK